MKVCMQETESVMSALHSVAETQLSPASRYWSKTSTWPQVCVCVWNGAGRPLTVLKHAKIKHAEARGKTKHAGWTASLHANDPFHLTDSL